MVYTQSSIYNRWLTDDKFVWWQWFFADWENIDIRKSYKWVRLAKGRRFNYTITMTDDDEEIVASTGDWGVGWSFAWLSILARSNNTLTQKYYNTNTSSTNKYLNAIEVWW